MIRALPISRCEPSPFVQQRPTVDGRVAMDNVARAFWQSRMSTAGQAAPLPKLTDLRALARDIRQWAKQ